MKRDLRQDDFVRRLRNLFLGSPPAPPAPIPAWKRHFRSNLEDLNRFVRNVRCVSCGLSIWDLKTSEPAAGWSKEAVAGCGECCNSIYCGRCLRFASESITRKETWRGFYEGDGQSADVIDLETPQQNADTEEDSISILEALNFTEGNYPARDAPRVPTSDEIKAKDPRRGVGSHSGQDLSAHQYLKQRDDLIAKVARGRTDKSLTSEEREEIKRIREYYARKIVELS